MLNEYKKQYNRCHRRLRDVLRFRDEGIPYRDPKDMTIEELSEYGVTEEDRRLLLPFLRFPQQGFTKEQIEDLEKRMPNWLRATTNKSPDCEDAIHTFFQNCYHLKDWIKNDPNSLFREKVEEFVSASNNLSLCADICNGSKHLKLTKLRSGHLPKVGGHEASFRPRHTKDRRIHFVHFRIEHNGKIIDAFDLAENCMTEWQRFLGL
jgi:hypothetical protein